MDRLSNSNTAGHPDPQLDAPTMLSVPFVLLHVQPPHEYGSWLIGGGEESVSGGLTTSPLLQLSSRMVPRGRCWDNVWVHGMGVRQNDGLGWSVQPLMIPSGVHAAGMLRPLDPAASFVSRALASSSSLCCPKHHCCCWHRLAQDAAGRATKTAAITTNSS